MTLSLDEAVPAAREFLGQVYAAGEFTVVMQRERSEEHAAAWAIRFTSQEYLDTGNVALQPFTRVVIVPKDGSAPRFPPSHLPVATYVAQLATDRPVTGA
ncbi:YrhB domain-containing protein [Streptomyces sp. NPDC021212]|uniref:YrhB domain-containing protein n=1 Tax=Streptomyces sp. NPDC021212 TaxID=3365118 RepID=UPI0037992953